MESQLKTITYECNTETMSSDQLIELLGFSSKSSLHRKIRTMFQDKIDSGVITADKFETGHVERYHLPELESKMFVAKHDISYLEKITQYWIDKNKPKAIDDNNQLLALAHGVIRLQGELEEAKRTKAHINDKRTATLMGKAGADAKRIKKLESQLQDQGTHISILAAKLPERIDTDSKKNLQTWRVLKALSENLGYEIIKVSDPRFGEVNTYDKRLIEKFKRVYM